MRHELFHLRVERAAIERLFGPPFERDQILPGICTYDSYTTRCPCGLEVVALFSEENDAAQIYATDDDLEHVFLHLDLPRANITWRSEDGEPRFQIMRQDDNGREYAMLETRSEAHANCRAATLEAAGHKQTYCVTPL